MLNSQAKAISISTNQGQSTLSKGQKSFNTLIKKIEAKRIELAAWQEAIPFYQKKHSVELAPLLEIAQDLHVDIVYSLDRMCGQKGLTKPERDKLGNVIAALAGDLAAERDDDELKSLYNKYSGSDFDAEEAEEAYRMKLLMESMTGVDLGDDLDASSPEEMMQRMREKLQEQQAKNAAERESATEEGPPTRKKTAKQLAKEARELAEEQEISQSIREVYRKLVSALHPDREPDLQERERKTALMQRVNQAYDKKNLLLLLELQLELEHIDQAAINDISESRLKHFTKVLKEQLGELEQEILQTDDLFRMQFNLDPYERLIPATIMRQLDFAIADMALTIRDLKNDLLMFEDIKKLKVWLKSLRKPRRKMDPWDDECPF
jgi:hypothetical protein